jgi:hypothetical protein
MLVTDRNAALLADIGGRSNVLSFKPPGRANWGRRFISWLFCRFRKRPGTSIASVRPTRRLRSGDYGRYDPDDAA